MIKEMIDQLMVLYAETDERTAVFQKTSGLRCPPGCGLCCRSAKVEATILEMLPIAEWLHNAVDRASWMEKLDAFREEKSCLFFKPHLSILTDGQCLVYSRRPLLCRLFGFASFRNKYGTRKTALCRRMRQTMADAPERFNPSDNTAPAFVDNPIRVSLLHPELGSRLFPINFAAYAAFEKYALWAQLAAFSKSVLSVDPETGPRNPTSGWKYAA